MLWWPQRTNQLRLLGSIACCAACATTGTDSGGSPQAAEISDAEVFRTLVAEYVRGSPIPLVIDPRPMAPEPVLLDADRIDFHDDSEVAAVRRRVIAGLSGATEAPLTSERRCPPQQDAPGVRECPEYEYAQYAFSMPWQADLSQYVPAHQRRLRPIVGDNPVVVRVYFLDHLEGGRRSAGVMDWFIGRVEGELVILEKLGLAWAH